MQSDAQVRLVFAGEIREGFQADDVKRRFGEAFKLGGPQLAAMFSGERTVLKRSLSRVEADRYVAQLGKLGARVHIEPLETTPATAAMKPVAAAAAAAVPAAPVTATSNLPPAEEEIVCPTCGTRQSKRILCKECATDMPRGIAAKKEDEERARAERLEEARARRAGSGRWAPPGSAGDAALAGNGVEPPPLLGLGFDGRIGRISYLLAWPLALLGLAGIGIGAAVLLPMLRSWLVAIPLGLAFVLFLAWSIRVTVLRLHDINRSGWWVLLGFVPYVGWIVNLLLLVVPGSADENDHGERPRQGNAVLAIVLVVVVVLALLAAGRFAMNIDRRGGRGAQAAERIEANPEAAQRAAQSLNSPAALKAFDVYAHEPNHKAFAASDDGAWGWRSGQASPREAAKQALATCEENRKPYTSECELLNINGAWAE